MDISYSRAELAFRDEVREFLAQYAHVDGFYCQDERWPAVRAMFSAMAEKNWLALNWPAESGGLDRGPVYEYLLWDEVAFARAARTPASSGIVARSIIRHGSAHQKSVYLPQIRSGEIHFCLCYSEPDAGSDLANLELKATRDGDGYILNGQKRWQAHVQDADYLWVLARTRDAESGDGGLSLFLCDKSTPGISIAPVPSVYGDQLNDVFLADVRIAATELVGDENGGLPIVHEALADERHLQFLPGRVRRDLKDMVIWLNDHGLDRVPEVRSRMAELTAQVMETEALGMKVLESIVKGKDATVDEAINKIVHTATCQDIARAVLDIGGPQALLAGQPELVWRQSLAETIAGGTTEMMRSVVSRKFLGLAG